MIIVLANYAVLQDTLYIVNQSNGTQWQVVPSILTVVVSSILAYVAWATFREYNRPYVTLYAETGKHREINLVIKNTGNRAAYNVRITTDVPLESAHFSQNSKSNIPLLTEKTHPFIGPDQTISGYFDNVYSRYDTDNPNHKKPCDLFTVTIKYRHKMRKFTEKYQLDLSYLEFVPWGNSRDHIAEISSSLRKISDQLPGGMAHAIRAWFRTAPNMSQLVREEQTCDGTQSAEDIANETK